MAAGKEVRVEFQKHDRYGRVVGKVWVRPSDCPTCRKTLDVGLAQITSGMAWWYRYYAHEQSREDQGRYEFAEQEAKAKRAGLRQDKNPEPPWEFRHRCKQIIRPKSPPSLSFCFISESFARAICIDNNDR